MIQALRALLIALFGGTLLCIALLGLGVPHLPMLLASEAFLVALFSVVFWWPPHVWRSRLRQKPVYPKIAASKIIILGSKRGYQPTDTPPPQSPSQSISGIIPYGQAPEDNAATEAMRRWVRYEEKADYEAMMFAPPDWQKKE